MAKSEVRNLPYRKNTVAIIRHGDEFLLVQLHEWPGYCWKFPQGGVDEGETRRAAVRRELSEELGSKNFKIIKMFPFKHEYDWDERSRTLAKNRWRGQRQRFFLVDYFGEKKDLVFDAKEIKAHVWVTLEEVIKRVNVDHPLFKGYGKVIKKCLESL